MFEHIKKLFFIRFVMVLKCKFYGCFLFEIVNGRIVAEVSGLRRTKSNAAFCGGLIRTMSYGKSYSNVNAACCGGRRPPLLKKATARMP